MSGRGFGAFLAVAMGLAGITACERVESTVEEWLERRRAAAPAASYLPKAPRVSGQDLPDFRVPSEPPFVGKQGVDAFGYPKRRPDRILLLQLLRRRDFERLERFMTFYQSEFEKDYHKEYWGEDVLETFAVRDPALKAPLDAWVEQAPSSFAPWAARAAYTNGLAWHYRGGKVAKETSKAQFQRMAEMNAAASRDLKRALELRPTLVAAHALALSIASTNGATDDALEALLAQGLEHCPLCYEIRAKYLHSLTPRWGGSHAAMKRFTDSLSAQASDNPKLRVLAGFVQDDLCSTLRDDGKLVAATAACDAALQFGDDPRLLENKLWLLLKQKRYEDMLPLADRALSMSPQHAGVLKLRYHARLQTDDYVGAAEDLLVERQLRPADSWIAEQTDWMVGRLRADGDRLRKAGNSDAAARHYEIALKLAPRQSDLRRRMGEGDRDDVERLLEELETHPDDFDAHLRVDHALALEHRYAEVVTMWNAYVARNPEDARAYYERGGAQYRQRKREQAKADLKRACDLHMQRACSDLRRMKTETR